MRHYLIVFIYLIVQTAAISKPLEGYVSNDIAVKLCPLTAKPDKRLPIRKGKIETTYIRGLIGVQVNAATGEIAYICPNSDILKYGIKTGDYIIAIEKESFRPCLLPGISSYPADYILNLTIKQSNGNVLTVPVKLLDYRLF